MKEIALDKEQFGCDNADAYIRKSYHGGISYLKPEYAGKLIKGGWTADINSSYPSNMSSESGNEYPVGRPIFWVGDIPDKVDGKFWFVRIRCRFYLKPGHIPTIQIKGSFLYNSTEFLTTSDVYDHRYKVYRTHYLKNGIKMEAKPTLTLTMMDYQRLHAHYDVIGEEILDGCYFYSEVGLFDNYMYKYKHIKQTTKGAERELAKLYLNNLYGKFATSDDSTYKIPYLNDKDCVDFDIIDEHKKDVIYIPVGTAITSYAREFLINAIQANYDNFIYCDTDSIHCKGDASEAKGIRIHDTDFCAWKLESYWDEAIFVRQKTYVEHITHNDGKAVDPYYKITCAGMSARAKKEFIQTKKIEDFKLHLKIGGNLKPKRIPGGVVLEDKDYNMAPKRWKAGVEFLEEE